MRPDLYAVITSQRTFEAKVAHERAQVREEEARHERRMRALRLPQQALSATRPGSAARARERRLVLDRLSFQALERQHTFADLAEYKRFMALKAAAGDFYGTVLSPPDAVDRVWRTHTEDALSYLAMCELLVPGFFIHRHPRPVVRPTRPGVPETAREARDQRRRQRALCAYKEAWSEHPPPPCWSEHLVAPSAPAKAPEGEPAHRLPPHLASAHRDPPHLKRDEAPREDDLISHLSALRLTRAAPSSYLPYSPNLIVLKLSGNQARRVHKPRLEEPF